MLAIKPGQLFQLSAVLYVRPQGVDLDKRVIRGVAVITKGEAKTYGLEIDEKTLSQIVALGNGNVIKARFGHPKQVQDGIGSFLGTYSNFRIEGDKVLADLAIDELADESPKYPKMGSYVLKFATKFPDNFGASVSFFGEPEVIKGVPHARPRELRAVDIVDEPAANPSGLFSINPLTERKEFSMSQATCPKCGEKFDLSDDDKDKEKKDLSRGNGTQLSHDCVSSYITNLSLDQARKLIDGRADLVEALREEGRVSERKYRQEFSTIVDAAGIKGQEAVDFAKKYDGRKLEDVKEFAVLVAGKRTTPVGEGGADAVELPEGKKKTDKVDPTEFAKKRFADDAALRQMHNCLSTDPNSDEWKKAEEKYVKAHVANATTLSK